MHPYLSLVYAPPPLLLLDLHLLIWIEENSQTHIGSICTKQSLPVYQIIEIDLKAVLYAFRKAIENISSIAIYASNVADTNCIMCRWNVNRPYTKGHTGRFEHRQDGIFDGYPAINKECAICKKDLQNRTLVLVERPCFHTYCYGCLEQVMLKLLMSII